MTKVPSFGMGLALLCPLIISCFEAINSVETNTNNIRPELAPGLVANRRSYGVQATKLKFTNRTANMVHGDTKMFSAGSAEPELANSTEKYILYSMRFCPFAQRARTVLAAKEIPYEIINIDLKNKPEWFLKRNPLGKVPTFQEPDGKLTYESLIVSEYIDDKFDTGLKLLPEDIYERAKQKMLVEVIDQKFLSKYGAAQFKGGDDNLKAVLVGLTEVEHLLTDKYFSGSKIGYVDVMIWPWLCRLNNLKDIRGLDIPEEKYPKVFGWVERMKEFAFIRSTTYPVALMSKFAIPYVAGHPNYDEGL